MKNSKMYLVLDGANTPAVLDYLETNKLPYVSGIAPEDLEQYLYKPYKYNYTVITHDLKIINMPTLKNFFKNNFLSLWLV